MVSITDLHGRHQERVRMGVLAAEAVYARIDRGEPLMLDLRYIKDFSFATYRKTRNLRPDQVIELKDFSASWAFFDSIDPTDFSHLRFTGSVTSFSNCYFGDGPLTFYNSKFQAAITDFSLSHFGAGVANFQYASFASTTLSFDHAFFQAGDVLFVNCDIGDCNVSFREVHFGDGKVDFHYTRFGSGLITFDKAVFGGGEVSFKRVDFGEGKVDFKRTHFGDGSIDFSEAEFNKGRVVFRSAIFGNGNISFQECVSHADFVFDNAEFGKGSLSFFKAQAPKLSFRHCHFNNYVDLRVLRVQDIDLSHTIVRDIIDLMPTEQSPVHLNQMVFSGMRNLGNVYIDWERNDVLQLIHSQTDTTKREKSQQFLILKETYNATGRYSDEDRAYVWYKRFELQADLEYSLKHNPRSAIWAYPTAFFKWLLFDKIGLYATEPLRVLFSVSVIYTLFSLLYLVLPFVADTYIDTGGGEVLQNMNEVTKAFYYSAITFLTIGYGEFYPVGIMRFFASVEGYVGVFLMGYFSVAFVRKVLR
jgi:hypothetical protein